MRTFATPAVPAGPKTTRTDHGFNRPASHVHPAITLTPTDFAWRNPRGFSDRSRDRLVAPRIFTGV